MPSRGWLKVRSAAGYDVNSRIKKLSLDLVERSPEVQSWLRQFQEANRGTATDMLLSLAFITRDVYSEWLKSELLSFDSAPCGIYAVRKFDESIPSIWDEKGEMVARPGSSMGSEDLVQSVIANLKKAESERLFDHPSLAVLEKERIHDILLLDDSLGSGQRVSSFIQMMMANKHFRSWWSLGWIRLHIVAFARTEYAESKILNSIPGSDHHKRKFPKSAKVHFHGKFAYDGSKGSKRWGENGGRIHALCKSQAEIPVTYRLGFGETMANIVFYHSVPDNIPGVFWYESSKWTALFPKRSLPGWLPVLLDGGAPRPNRNEVIEVSENILAVLRLVKRGLRQSGAIARAIGMDPGVMKALLTRAKSAGLLTDSNRVTEAGQRALRKAKPEVVRAFDRSLYVPKISCVGWGTVQPSAPDRLARTVQAESGGGLPLADGGAGQASLEKTDAKTAVPSLSIMPQLPSQSRVGHDAHGPRDRKVE